MPTDLDPVAVLRRTDPAAHQPVPHRPPLDELTALPPVSRTRPNRSRLVVLAAAVLLVAVLVGTAVVLATVDADDAPTPPVTEPPSPLTGSEALPALLDLGPAQPAAPHLLALAALVEADTTPVPAGSLAYARSVGLASEITASADEPTTIAYDSGARETWIEPDGTLHVLDGEGAPTRDGQVVQVDPALPPGEERPSGEGVPAFAAGVLVRPVGDDAVRADLLAERGEEPEAYAALDRFADVLGRQPLSGPDRAALYRALATIDGIEHRGEVTDRAGRDGIAFSYESDFSGALSELIVIVDSDTGALLQTEKVMLASAPAIPLDEPLVQSYHIVLEVASVEAVGERPE